MAKRIQINKPMAEALKKNLRMDNCPNCGMEIEMHSWIQVKGREVESCSNRP